ncbi:hypothetical protein PGIGA_G00190540 [Pangasianodon gigas]|uniref:Uncharacterized protein n=1 Tax=Pangasianodon gigas TaxID=30993 RepID=A0ACC5WDC7_PANGG|nr:hypothetical protein [Pangasianodon gigas]
MSGLFCRVCESSCVHGITQEKLSCCYDSICQAMPDLNRKKSFRRTIRHGKAQDYLCSTFIIGKLASASLDLESFF